VVLCLSVYDLVGREIRPRRVSDKRCTQPQGFIHKLPSCRVTLRGRKSRPPGYPESPQTLGEHLRQVRLDRGLSQRRVAREIGCSQASLANWEKGHRAPEIRFLPSILAFLGYDPRPEPLTFGGRVRAAREGKGLSEQALARRLGLDPSTVCVWERDAVRRPYPHIRQTFERYLASLG
jgi:transcriptional regulator with XRE-family HTH domain